MQVHAFTQEVAGPESTRQLQADGVALAGFSVIKRATHKVSLTPNHREREFMQRLRGRGWVKAIELPDAGITLRRLFEKRWVKVQRVGKQVSYRITDEGIAAKTALIPLKR